MNLQNICPYNVKKIPKQCRVEWLNIFTKYSIVRVAKHNFIKRVLILRTACTKPHLENREEKAAGKKRQTEGRETHTENTQLGKNLNVHRLIGFRFWSGLQEVILSNLLLKVEPTTRLDHSFMFFSPMKYLYTCSINFICFWYLWRHLKFRISAFISLQLTVVLTWKSSSVLSLAFQRLT